jgi:hypothetical protein
VALILLRWLEKFVGFQLRGRTASIKMNYLFSLTWTPFKIYMIKVSRLQGGLIVSVQES